MGLVVATLKADIKSILTDLKDDVNQEVAIEKYAHRLSLAIDKYIRSGTVEVEAGIAVSTTGSSSAQSGVTTAKGIGTIK